MEMGKVAATQEQRDFALRGINRGLRGLVIGVGSGIVELAIILGTASGVVPYRGGLIAFVGFVVCVSLGTSYSGEQLRTIPGALRYVGDRMVACTYRLPPYRWPWPVLVCGDSSGGDPPQHCWRWLSCCPPGLASRSLNA